MLCLPRIRIHNLKSRKVKHLLQTHFTVRHLLHYIGNKTRNDTIETKIRFSLSLLLIYPLVSVVKKKKKRTMEKKLVFCGWNQYKLETHAIYSPWWVIIPHFSSEKQIYRLVFTCKDAMAERKSRKHSLRPSSHQEGTAQSNMQKSHLGWQNTTSIQPKCRSAQENIWTLSHVLAEHMVEVKHLLLFFPKLQSNEQTLFSFHVF